MPQGGKFRKVLGHVLTPLIVLLGFVLFRADTLAFAGTLYAQMVSGFVFTPQSDALLRQILSPLNVFTIVVGILLSAPLLPWFRSKLESVRLARAAEVLSYVAAAGLFCLSVMNLASSDFNPFIYFRF